MGIDLLSTGIKIAGQDYRIPCGTCPAPGIQLETGSLSTRFWIDKLPDYEIIIARTIGFVKSARRAMKCPYIILENWSAISELVFVNSL